MKIVPRHHETKWHILKSIVSKHDVIRHHFSIIQLLTSVKNQAYTLDYSTLKIGQQSNNTYCWFL